MTLIVCIVEGQGDAESLPIILRRLAEQRSVFDLKVETIRISRYKVVREGLAAQFDPDLARRFSPSFGRLYRVVNVLLQQAGR